MVVISRDYKARSAADGFALPALIAILRPAPNPQRNQIEMQYVVANRVFVKPDYAQEFEQRFRRRAGQIDRQPGFVRMEILKPRSAGTPYVVLTHWVDEQAFRDWVGSEDFRTAHQNPMPAEAFAEGGGLEQYEVIIDSGTD